MSLMWKSPTSAIVVLFSWFACQVTVSQLYAQEDGIFVMQRPKMGLGAYYKLVDEKRETQDSERRVTKQKFRESVTVATRGWLYHPDLMEYHLSFQPEWQQQTFRQNQAAVHPTHSEEQNTSLLAYDVGATFLKHKPLSLNIFANRKTGQIDFINAQDSDIESETLGTRLNLNNPRLPVFITWTHRTFDQTGFYASEEERDEAAIAVQHHANRSVTRLNMKYTNSETTRTDFDTLDITSTVMNTEFTNVLFLSDDERVRLDSRMYTMQADYCDLDQTTLAVSENLFWTHSKTLLTRYRADYSLREFDGFENEEKGLGVSLTHHLLDRLTTDLGAQANFGSFESSREDLYQSNLGFLYHRPVSRGFVEFGAAYDYEFNERSGFQKNIPALAQPTLSTGVDSFLDKENIDLSSIVVTDLSGTTVYSENIDYQIETVGTMVRISRTILGAIADGQQVIVHYNYRLDAAYDDSRFGQKYRFGLKVFSHLYLSYLHSRMDQDIRSGEPPNAPLDDTSNTVRLSWVTKWSDTQFLYDNQDRSNDNSSVIRSVTERINFRPARNLLLNFSGKVGDRYYPDLDEEERFYSLGSTLNWTPRWWCNFDLICLRHIISGDQREEQNTEVAATAKLIYGIWTGNISCRLRDQDDQQNGNSLWRQEVILLFTRRLW